MEEFLAEALFALEVDGYTVVPDVLTAAQAAAVLGSVEETMASEAYKAAPAGSTFINFNQSFAAFLADLRVLGIAEQLFGPAGSHTRIAATSCIVQAGSGEGGTGVLGDPGGFHADWPWSQTGPPRRGR